jgi:hypothetical protein
MPDVRAEAAVAEAAVEGELEDVRVAIIRELREIRARLNALEETVGHLGRDA